MERQRRSLGQQCRASIVPLWASSAATCYTWQQSRALGHLGRFPSYSWPVTASISLSHSFSPPLGSLSLPSKQGRPVVPRCCRSLAVLWWCRAREGGCATSDRPYPSLTQPSPSSSPPFKGITSSNPNLARSMHMVQMLVEILLLVLVW